MLINLQKLPEVPYEGMNLVHRQEVQILNQLYDALKKNEPEEKIEKLLRNFEEDLENHFSYEEDLMKRTGFFAYECHLEEHNRVRKEVKEVINQWKESKNNELLIEYFNETFKNWIVEHVLTMDTVTAQWINTVINGLPFSTG